ncbi:hypothetical protein O6H91_Y522500 [Diphasiastrum complanatum]|nr:hypothetical protein O6H91_Y522500 [Diphasiastrum complanatum]
MSKIFTSVENATYQKDTSILVTGEDVLSISDIGSVAFADPPATITNVTVRAEDEAYLRASMGSCDSSIEAINCSDPGVMVAIKKANLATFSDINLYAYRTPVRGSANTDCDVAWRFKPKKEHSHRMYRDFRRYKLRREASCGFTVIDIGDLHSGENARPQKFRINDSVPTLDQADMSKFRNSKYLYYSRGGDYCKGMNQFQWSFLCALGEAQYLNRTFVVDLDFCLSGSNNPGHGDETGKDLRFYFDYEHLMEATSVIEQKQFLKAWQDWNKIHNHNYIPVRVVPDLKVTPMQLRSEESTVLWRTFDQPEPNNYWYRVCEGESEKVIQRPWHLLWKSKRLMDIVTTICGSLEWDFDAVHIVRGQKAQNKELWPNLDADTSPESILQKLKGKIEEGRNVYIATNEVLPGYFDKLRTSYKIHLLDDYKHLWAPGSEWYNETKALNNGHSVDFDGQMRVEVDSEMFFRGKKHIETFDEITLDCKDGVNTCK